MLRLRTTWAGSTCTPYTTCLSIREERKKNPHWMQLLCSFEVRSANTGKSLVMPARRKTLIVSFERRINWTWLVRHSFVVKQTASWGNGQWKYANHQLIVSQTIQFVHTSVRATPFFERCIFLSRTACASSEPRLSCVLLHQFVLCYELLAVRSRWNALLATRPEQINRALSYRSKQLNEPQRIR